MSLVTDSLGDHDCIIVTKLRVFIITVLSLVQHQQERDLAEKELDDELAE